MIRSNVSRSIPAGALITTISVLAVLVVAAFLFPTQAAVVAVIVALFVMIMLHELGHFVAAKRSGMKVTEFFVGFGPRLWSFTRGETEYGIKGVPLGGYCRIIGMTNLEEVDPADEPRAYRNKPTFSKVFVAAAGPAVHFAIALVLMFVVLFFAGDFRNRHTTMTLSQTSQGAAAAGLKAGDTVVAINGTRATSWTQVQQLINPPENPAHVGDVVHFDVLRGNENIQIAVKLQESTDAGPKRVIAGVAPTSVVPRPGLVTSIAQAPRQVADTGWESIKAIGSMFSPSGISNYFHILSGDTEQERRSDEALRLAGGRRRARERRGPGRLGERVQPADRDQHLRRVVQPAPVAALRRRAHRDRALRERRVAGPAPPGPGRRGQAVADHGGRGRGARLHLLVEPVPRHHPPHRQPVLKGYGEGLVSGWVGSAVAVVG